MSLSVFRISAADTVRVINKRLDSFWISRFDRYTAKSADTPNDSQPPAKNET